MISGEHISTILSLKRGDLLSSLISEIQIDIALKIVQTPVHQKDKREELYMLTQALNGLEGKLQEYVNEYDKIQESE